jgi:hypothetical protein
MMPRTSLWFVLMVGVAAGAWAQSDEPVTIDKVVVTLSGHGDCREFKDVISVVVNGNEKHPARATRSKSDSCRWSGPSDYSFDANDAYASLRLGRARTDCRNSAAEDDEDAEDESVARLKFDGILEPARNVRVRVIGETTNDATSFRYVREVGPFSSASIACRESATISPGDEELIDVWSSESGAETIRLQVEWEPSETDSTGIFIHDPGVGRHAEKQRPRVFTPRITGSGFAATSEAVAEPMQGSNVRRLVFTIDGFAETMADQIAEGKLSVAPHLSGNSRDIERKRLKDKKVKSIELWME